MKKIFTIIALLALTLTAGAKDFTDQLSISLAAANLQYLNQQYLLRK